MEDAAIVGLYWDRDQRALEESAAKYGPYCRSVAYGILRSREDAEETVNDTWLRAWNSMPPHRPQGLGAFLGRITRGLSLDRWRRRNAGKRGGGEPALALEELAECVSAGGSIQETLEARELGALIDRFLAGLPPVERQVFVRRYWYLEPVEGIGRRFGFSRSKVKSMLGRTRGGLREFLRGEGIMDGQ